MTFEIKIVKERNVRVFQFSYKRYKFLQIVQFDSNAFKGFKYMFYVIYLLTGSVSKRLTLKYYVTSLF